MIDMQKLTSTASGIGPVASRHRLPSCSLVRLRVSAGNRSTVTSPTLGLARLAAGPVGTSPAPTIGWSPIAADTCRK